MLIVCINIYGLFCVIDYVLFLCDYIDIQESLFVQDMILVFIVVFVFVFQSVLVKVIDYLWCGICVFLEWVFGVVCNWVSDKCCYGDLLEIV